MISSARTRIPPAGQVKYLFSHYFSNMATVCPTAPPRPSVWQRHNEPPFIQFTPLPPARKKNKFGRSMELVPGQAGPNGSQHIDSKYFNYFSHGFIYGTAAEFEAFDDLLPD